MVVLIMAEAEEEAALEVEAVLLILALVDQGDLEQLERVLLEDRQMDYQTILLEAVEELHK